jgi:hypothetical protein
MTPKNSEAARREWTAGFGRDLCSRSEETLQEELLTFEREFTRAVADNRFRRFCRKASAVSLLSASCNQDEGEQQCENGGIPARAQRHQTLLSIDAWSIEARCRAMRNDFQPRLHSGPHVVEQ